MATLVEKLRQITAIEGDDFFSDSGLLFYINEANKEVINLITTKELSNRKSFRVLDKLRDTQSVVIDVNDYVTVEDWYEIESTLAATFGRVANVTFGTKTNCRELPIHRKALLYNGNVKPSSFEGYYTVLDGTPKSMVMYVDNNTTTSANIEFYNDIVALVLGDTNLTQLSDSMESAVLYKAAVLLLSQETVLNVDANLNFFKEQYTTALTSNLN